MRTRPIWAIPLIVLAFAVFVCAALIGAQSNQLKVEDVMTPQELKDTGLVNLTSVQKKTFDEWLTRYTTTIFNVAASQHTNESFPKTPDVKTSCAPAIESTLGGEFNGWDGDTIFKLDNGQIWEQAEYSYMYSYSFRPEVTIYQVTAGCRMKVEGEDEDILVRRIK